MQIPPLLRVAFCLALIDLASFATNLTPFGDLERGNRGDRPAEFWHRAGDDYLSAYPDWKLTGEHKASGRYSVTTDTDREFVVYGEGQGGWITGSVRLRAEEPGARVRIRLSWWNRRTRSDEVKVVEAGPTWQRYELKTEALRGQPMEIAVKSEKPGVRVWADDFRIEGAPVADQFTDRTGLGDKAVTRPVPPVRPGKTDLSRIQDYRGNAQDKTGRVPLSIDVPPDCVEIPCVSGGVPFPKGQVFRIDRMVVRDGSGRETVSQINVLSRWPADRSIMVALVTVSTPAASCRLTLHYGPAVKRSGPPRTQPPVRGVGAVNLLAIRLEDADGKSWRAIPQRFSDDLFGPLRRDYRVWGEFRDPGGRRRGSYITRVTSFQDQPGRSLVSFSWIHDEREPSTPIVSASLGFGELSRQPRPAFFETQVAAGKQYYASRQPVVSSPKSQESSERLTGLLDGFVAARDFWQNHPMALEWNGRRAKAWLWPSSVRGVLIPQGFAREWSFLVDTDGKLTRPFQTEAMPLLRADPEWMCASGVFEHVMPPDPKTFPIFEQRVGQAKTLGRFARSMKERGNLYGVFNYGDAPGDGGWSNLESMAAHELFLHWIRKPSREHFDMARLAAEHYRDMDIHHGAGFCHTHCNNHVATGEGWSHSWIQGVRDLYFLLGDLRALEVLHEIGERLIRKPAGWTSGRDWTRSIDNLVDIYAATGDPRYRAAAMKQVRKLGKRQLPRHAVPGAERHSWYEDRYTAGCAFTWYGCQAMAKLHRLTGDPEVLRILKREVDLSLDVQTKSVRSHGILPDTKLTEDHAAMETGRFALGRGSTLFPPLGYLAAVTGERRHVAFGMNILAHYMLNLRGGSDASATSYATVFLNYAKQTGIGPREEAAAFQRARDFSYERWPNAVANGGFEGDHFRHWNAKKVPRQDFYYDKLVRVGYYQDGKVSRSGQRSLRLHSDNRLRVMSVSGRFRLEPRRRYRASLWVKAEKTMNPSFAMSCREYDTDRGYGLRLRATGKEDNGWKEYAGEFMTSVRAVLTVSLGNRRGTGDVWYDDVAVVDQGRVHSLLTNNGNGRDWSKTPPYPDLAVATGGSYLPDKKMSTDMEPEGTPILFTKGCLTDGVSKYDYRQKPRGAYNYWHGRKRGSILFDLKNPYRIRSVRLNVLIDSNRKAHGVRRIELRHGSVTGKILGVIEPAQNGWNGFETLDVTAERLTLVLYKLEGRSYLTLSEVEIWGERP